MFAITKEVAGGKSEIELVFNRESITFKDLIERILQLYPEMKSIPFVVAVNYKIVTEAEQAKGRFNTLTKARLLSSDDEIALLPPVSGG